MFFQTSTLFNKEAHTKDNAHSALQQTAPLLPTCLLWSMNGLNNRHSYSLRHYPGRGTEPHDQRHINPLMFCAPFSLLVALCSSTPTLLLRLCCSAGDLMASWLSTPPWRTPPLSHPSSGWYGQHAHKKPAQ